MGDFDPTQHMDKLRGGAEYLPVKWRMVWFRQEHPDGQIDTEHITLSDQLAIFRATVSFPTEGGTRGLATGYGSETPKDFGDYIEKAETKAIGRALAALGFGTQFAADLEEGERIADAPVDPPAPLRRNTPVTRSVPRHASEPPEDVEQDAFDLGDAILAGFLTSIEHATSEKDLDAIGREIKRSRLGQLERESLRDPFTRKLMAFQSTT